MPKLETPAHIFRREVKNALPVSSINCADEVVFISPDLILSRMRLDGHPQIDSAARRFRDDNSRVVGAIVDESKIIDLGNFEDDTPVRAMRKRFVEGAEWEETEYWDLFNNYMKKRKVYRNTGL